MRQWNHEDVDDLAFFEAEKMRGKVREGLWGGGNGCSVLPDHSLKH